MEEVPNPQSRKEVLRALQERYEEGAAGARTRVEGKQREKRRKAGIVKNSEDQEEQREGQPRQDDPR